MQNELFSRYDKNQLDRFKKFHSENPHVYTKFKSLVSDMKASGRKKYSARTIFEVMRWSYDLKTKSDDFKISNDFIPIYVRLLVYHKPELRDFFSLKGVNDEFGMG